MYLASNIKFTLHFRKPSGTSRGILTEKDSWFIKLSSTENREIIGLGECSLIPGLSPEKWENFESVLDEKCLEVTQGKMELSGPIPLFPSIQFGLETALLDLKNGGKRILFPSEFTNGQQGIPINGLIWMGDKNNMLQQIADKLNHGFSILKLKVGAIDFQEELDILRTIRNEYKEKDLEIRLDANGAWSTNNAISRLQRLAMYKIHSLEQPIKAGNIEEMASVCSSSPIPIALDEELIGIEIKEDKKNLLESIHPSFIILKPSMLGGFKASEEWIRFAAELNIGWWVTSALESNIGLNAIAQWTATLNTKMPQGLGTGTLFTNNFPSPLSLSGSRLFYRPENSWDISNLFN